MDKNKPINCESIVEPVILNVLNTRITTIVIGTAMKNKIVLVNLSEKSN